MRKYHGVTVVFHEIYPSNGNHHAFSKKGLTLSKAAKLAKRKFFGHESVKNSQDVRHLLSLTGKTVSVGLLVPLLG